MTVLLINEDIYYKCIFDIIIISQLIGFVKTFTIAAQVLTKVMKCDIIIIEGETMQHFNLLLLNPLSVRDKKNLIDSIRVFEDDVFFTDENISINAKSSGIFTLNSLKLRVSVYGPNVEKIKNILKEYGSVEVI